MFIDQLYLDLAISNMSAPSQKSSHVLVYPFSASGHIIPLLDLTHLLLTRGLTVTVLVAPTELPLLEPLLSNHPSSLHTLILSPPPATNSSLIEEIRAMADELYDPIVQWFQSHPSPPIAIISDFFLGWTHQLASHLGVPRVVFWPSGAFAASVCNSEWRDLPKNEDLADQNFLISFEKIPNLPSFPWWQISHLYRQYKDGEPDWEFFRNGMLANMKSWGVVFNSFFELEQEYIEHLKEDMGHNQVWAVGPLLPFDDPITRGGSSAVSSKKLMTWLHEKVNNSVVYVCFGSRFALTHKQMSALLAALECSQVHFILCMQAINRIDINKSDIGMIPDGFEDRAEGRGFIINGWAPQVSILRHRAVGVFVTHCGWNSVLEGLAAGVMMLAWPMAADQFINAKLLVDQLGVAVRVCEGGTQMVPNSAELAHLLTESVSGSRPERVRAMDLHEAASEAVNGGSSSKDLDILVKQLVDLQNK